jgi:hypothetical protein
LPVEVREVIDRESEGAGEFVLTGAGALRRGGGDEEPGALVEEWAEP